MNYQIILADPPWKYNDKLGKTSKWGSAEKHYKCMSIKELEKINMQKISDKNCALFLWTTMPMIPNAIHLIKHWGFTYKTVAFTWIKTNPKSKTIFKGLGKWTQGNAELVLLATKGKIKRISKSVSQVIINQRTKHSEKPDIVKEKIVSLLGDLKRIELFARKNTIGWDSLGLELDGKDILDCL